MNDHRTEPPTRAHTFPSLADVATAAYLVGLIAYATSQMWPCLFRTWFYSSDEYVFAAEVIRFVQLDFRQHFFDIPGTPFMLLTALIWAVYYGVSFLAGGLATTGLEQFTFHNLPALFVTMRSLTFLFFAASIILVFFLASKFTNRYAGALAAAIVAMSPEYAYYSSFVRTESMAVCCLLASMLCLMSALEEKQPADSTASGRSWLLVLAGGLAGVGAAARMHSMTTSLPLLFLLLFAKRWRHGPPASHKPWIILFWKSVLAGTFLIGGFSLLLLQSGNTELTSTLPHASRFLSKIIIAAMVLEAAGLALWLMRPTRGLINRIIDEHSVKLLLGFAGGLLLGTPTILWQHHYFLRSVNFYLGSYVDHERASAPFLESTLLLARLYVDAVAPDPLVVLLFACGAVLILALADFPASAVLLVTTLFLVTRPPELRFFPHHVILWLPLVAIVAGYPIGKGFGLLSRWRDQRPGWLRAAAVSSTALVTLVLVFSVLTSGPKEATEKATSSEERMNNVSEATEWVKENTPTDTTILISYYCFNPDVFYAWLGWLEVPVPAYVHDGRNHVIWWGHKRAIAVRTGYVLVTKRDIKNIKLRLDKAEPGQGTDPFTEEGFEIISSFGDNMNEVFVFRFDFERQPEKPLSDATSTL